MDFIFNSLQDATYLQLVGVMKGVVMMIGEMIVGHLDATMVVGGVEMMEGVD